MEDVQNKLLDWLRNSTGWLLLTYFLTSVIYDFLLGLQSGTLVLVLLSIAALAIILVYSVLYKAFKRDAAPVVKPFK